jgi:hypothetical protein
VWIDGDTLIMNDEIKLENLIMDLSKNMDIMVAQDWTMLNTGVMFVKNSEWSRKFLELVYDQTEFLNHPNWEQGAFIHLLENNEMEAKSHINVLPLSHQNQFNSYWYSYNYRDFILHFPGCWRDNNDYGLPVCMEKFCPIKKDEEDEESFQRRLHWLEHESKNEANRMLQNHALSSKIK